MKILATQLALCAALVLTSLHSPQGDPIGDPTASTYGSPTSNIKLWHEANGYDESADPACIEEVQSVIDPILKTLTRESPLPRIRTALQQNFGADLLETFLPPRYVFVWVNNHWLLYCVGSSSFEIDFGIRGEVYLQIEEGWSMR